MGEKQGTYSIVMRRHYISFRDLFRGDFVDLNILVSGRWDPYLSAGGIDFDYVDELEKSPYLILAAESVSVLDQKNKVVLQDAKAIDSEIREGNWWADHLPVAVDDYFRRFHFGRYFALYVSMEVSNPALYTSPETIKQLFKDGDLWESLEDEEGPLGFTDSSSLGFCVPCNRYFEPKETKCKGCGAKAPVAPAFDWPL